MRSSLDEKCSDAVKRAVLLAEQVVSGDLAAIDAAETIARLGSFDCYEFLQEGFDLVDRMGGLWTLIYEWQGGEYSDPCPKDEVLRDIRQELSEFLVRAKGHDG
jgi:hypothetical protein